MRRTIDPEKTVERAVNQAVDRSDKAPVVEDSKEVKVPTELQEEIGEKNVIEETERMVEENRTEWTENLRI